MKKLFLFSIVLFLAISINAQIRFGVKAGGNFSNFHSDGGKVEAELNSDHFKGRFGYHFGGMMEYSFTKMFSIQPELMYMNHSAKLKDNNPFLMDKGHIMLNSLQLPVNIKAKFNIGNNYVFVYAGTYLSYNMYGKAKGKIDGISVEQELFSKGQNMKRWDYGVAIGVGVEIQKFILVLGNQHGLRDIDGSDKSKLRVEDITLSAGYFF